MSEEATKPSDRLRRALELAQEVPAFARGLAVGFSLSVLPSTTLAAATAAEWHAAVADIAAVSGSPIAYLEHQCKGLGVLQLQAVYMDLCAGVPIGEALNRRYPVR